MKVLLVGMADSIHLSRWLSQFDSGDTNFEIVSSSPHRTIQPGISQRAEEHGNVSFPRLSRHCSLLMWVADWILSDWFRGSGVCQGEGGQWEFRRLV